MSDLLYNIQFRGRINETLFPARLGTWVYGTLDKHPRNSMPDEFLYIIHDAKNEQLWHIDPGTAGRFTGLCDKSRHRIFEGDILSRKLPDNSELIAVVYFKRGAFYIKARNFKTDESENELLFDCFDKIKNLDYGYKVVGNIHDRPDYLKKSQQKAKGKAEIA